MGVINAEVYMKVETVLLTYKIVNE